MTASPEVASTLSMACVECRQHKVRCVGLPRDDGKCTRCVKRNIPCVVDKEFRRVSKRQRYEQIELENLRLKQQMARNSALSETTNEEEDDHSKHAAADAKTPEHEDSGDLDDSASLLNSNGKRSGLSKSLPLPQLASGAGNTFKPLPDYSKQVGDWECTEKTADGLTLDAPTIRTFFEEYVAHYHPVIPIVDLHGGPEKIYERSPALFWTMMALAARRHEDPEFRTELCAVQKTFLAELAVSPVLHHSTRGSSANSNTSSNASSGNTSSNSNTSDENGSASTPSNNQEATKFNLPNLQVVQAFIISSLWSMPTASFAADASWNTCGIAMFTAIRTGLHFPGHHREFGRIIPDEPERPESSEQVATWASVNAVGQMVASVYGFPSVAQFRNMSMVSGQGIPDRVRLSVLIQSVAHEAEHALYNGAYYTGHGLADISERFSIVRIFNDRLEDLEEKYSDSFDVYSRFELLAVRATVFAVYALDNNTCSASRVQRGLLAYYNACLAVMTHVLNAVEEDESILASMPLVHIQLLWQASTAICRVYHSRWATHFPKRQAKDIYFRIPDILFKAAVLDHDQSYRSAEMLIQMWHMFAANASKNSQIKKCHVVVNTRMAASVLFDCLWLLREICVISSQAPTVLQKRTSSTSSQTSTPGDLGSTPGSHPGTVGPVKMEESSLRSTTRGRPNLPKQTLLPKQQMQPEPLPMLPQMVPQIIPLNNAPANPAMVANSGVQVTSVPVPVISSFANQNMTNSATNPEHQQLPYGTSPPMHVPLPSYPAVQRQTSLKPVLENIHQGTPGSNLGSYFETPGAYPTNNRAESEWDAGAAWNDVNFMIEEFGFQPSSIPYDS